MCENGETLDVSLHNIRHSNRHPTLTSASLTLTYDIGAALPAACSSYRCAKPTPQTHTRGATFGRTYWTTHGERSIPINTHDPVREDIYISAQLHHRGTWDEYILAVFRHVLQGVPRSARPQQLVVDVGANIGFFSLVAASYGARTISFEPMRFNLDRMLASIERNPGFRTRMQVYNAAVSNAHQAVTLKPTSATTNAGNFFVQVTSESEAAIDFSTVLGEYGVDYVNSITLDDVLDEDVLLMKIDVETYEPFVVDGAYNLLCHNIVRHVILEVNKNQDAAHGGACPAQRMLQWMRDLGYDARDMSVGAPVFDTEGIDVRRLPQNVWFTLRNDSVPPAKRLGQKRGVCDSILDPV